MNKFIFLVIFVCIIGCSGSKKTRNYENLEINMEKTPCRGFCPVYNLSIKGSGEVILIGKKNISKIGTYYSKVPIEKLDSLINNFETINFWNLEDKYEDKKTDLPTTYIIYTNKGRTKRVKDYFGAPKGLKDLEARLHSLIESLDWTKLK